MCKTMAWIGSIAALIGALIIAAKLGPLILAFVVFLVGNLAWIFVAWRSGDFAQIAMQVSFLIVNAYGIANWALD